MALSFLPSKVVAYTVCKSSKTPFNKPNLTDIKEGTVIALFSPRT